MIKGSKHSLETLTKLKITNKDNFFWDWQERAKNSKIGKKRPLHSECMKKLYREGKMSGFRNYTTEQRSVMAKNAIIEHGHPRGMLGKKQSEKSKKQASINLINAWKDPNSVLNSKEYRQKLSDRFSIYQNLNGRSRYSRSRIGTYDINGKKLFFRSLWEANYALYLDFLIKQNKIKDWKYEVDTFWFEQIRRGTRSYKPDFKIVNNDESIEYHEVKGWMDPKSITKLKRMKKYHPNIKLVVIDGDYYKDIKKKIGRVIGFYE